MREVFAATFAALGERLEDHLDLRRIDPTYRIRFDDGLELELTSDLNGLAAQLKALSKHYDHIGRYLSDPHLKAAFTLQGM